MLVLRAYCNVGVIVAAVLLIAVAVASETAGESQSRKRDGAATSATHLLRREKQQRVHKASFSATQLRRKSRSWRKHNLQVHGRSALPSLEEEEQQEREVIAAEQHRHEEQEAVSPEITTQKSASLHEHHRRDVLADALAEGRERVEVAHHTRHKERTSDVDAESNQPEHASTPSKSLAQGAQASPMVNSASAAHDSSSGNVAGEPTFDGMELEYGMRIALAYTKPGQTTVGGGGEGSGEEPCDPEGCFVAYSEKNALQFTPDWNKKQMFYIRPPVASAVQGCVQYGHKVVLAISQETTRTRACGWYGCKVASIGGSSEMHFGKGEDQPTAFFVRPVPTPDGENSPDGNCVKYGDQIVLALSHENTKIKEYGWYGNVVASFEPSEYKMKFGRGGDYPTGFFVRRPPPDVKNDVTVPCEAQGMLSAPHTLSGEPMVDKHANALSCRKDCVKMGSLYYSFRIKDYSSQCRCGRKGKTFAWLVSQSAIAVNPWFKDPKPCNPLRPDLFCTQGTSCKRCLLANRERMSEETKNKFAVGDCRAIQPDQDCESFAEGTWMTVHQEECFQSCQLKQYIGMNFSFQQTLQVGACKPLYSLNQSKCEEWTIGEWETVAKGVCVLPGAWDIIGHFEDAKIFEEESKTSHSAKWRLTGNVLVGDSTINSSKAAEPSGPFKWLDLQKDCMGYKGRNSPGEASFAAPTAVGGRYVLIFQAAMQKDWDTDGVGHGFVTVDGAAHEYATYAFYDGMNRFEWQTIEVAFEAQGQATQLGFSAPADECIQVREVMLFKGPSFQYATNSWQGVPALIRAFNRIGCPIQFDQTDMTLFRAIERWREDENKALSDMWWICEHALAGSVAHQQLCCGQGKTCELKECHMRSRIEDEADMWDQWLWLKENVANQTGVQSEAEAHFAVDGESKPPLFEGNTCTHTEYMEKPWWKVRLGAMYDVAAVRITNCQDCAWSNPVATLEVLVSGEACIKGVAIAPGQTKEMPCIGTGRDVMVRLDQRDPGELTLCEVEVLVSGRANPRVPAKCPYELSGNSFTGTGNPWNGYMKKGEYLMSRQTFKRPVTIEAEIRADKPGCIAASLFASEGSPFSGYMLQTGVDGNWSQAWPGTDKFVLTGVNNAWQRLRIQAEGGKKIIFSLNGVPYFTSVDTSLQYGSLQFFASCVSARVRNVYVHSNGVCASASKPCRITLPLAMGGNHWTGTGNSALGTLNKGQFIQSRGKFTRPVLVRAQLRTDHPACTSLQLFGDEGERGSAETGYSITTGVRRYQAVVKPGGRAVSAGGNHFWHWVEIHAAADGNVHYYVNNRLITTIQNSSRTIGHVRIMANCVATEVRSVSVETLGNCQTKMSGQPHEIWMASE